MGSEDKIYIICRDKDEGLDILGYCADEEEAKRCTALKNIDIYYDFAYYIEVGRCRAEKKVVPRKRYSFIACRRKDEWDISTDKSVDYRETSYFPDCERVISETSFINPKFYIKISEDCSEESARGLAKEVLYRHLEEHKEKYTFCHKNFFKWRCVAKLKESGEWSIDVLGSESIGESGFANFEPKPSISRNVSLHGEVHYITFCSDKSDKSEVLQIARDAFYRYIYETKG